MFDEGQRVKARKRIRDDQGQERFKAGAIVGTVVRAKSAGYYEVRPVSAPQIKVDIRGDYLEPA